MNVIIDEWTTIPVTKKTAKELRKRSQKGKKYEDLITDMIKLWDYVHSEKGDKHEGKGS